MLLYFRKNNFSPVKRPFWVPVATFAAIQYPASFGAVPLRPYQFGTGVLLGKPPCWDEPGKDRLNCLTSPPILLSPVFPCGPGSREWEYFNGKCYYFSLTRMSWYKAKSQCEEMHSQLAIIDSYAKQNFVMFRTRNERFWIGLTDENVEGEWEWIDGTDYKTTFTFWKEGEPNNSGNEDCAHVWISGKWNDVYCTYECFYICEKPLPN
uniref:C-type lectin domain-containing protein n=1 Tax=Buteo japonicus TaxID=224669 RepID=A0A8C0C0N6_9AVES